MQVSKIIRLTVLCAATLSLSIWAASTELTRQSPLQVAILVDATASRHAISPLIYGINFGTTATLKDLRIPINRSGGDSASAYNWRMDARNAGRDWYFESLSIDPADPNDQFGDRFVALSRAGGAEPILTIPMLGRVAKLGVNRESLASFSIAKYGAQINHDVNSLKDAGNGVAMDGTPIINNSPDDATIPDDPGSQNARVTALVKEFSVTAAGNVHYYAMDNESSVWQLIHRDVHPTGAHAQEIADKVVAYSHAVKSVDLTAKILAPEEWGWQGYHDSGFDQQYETDHPGAQGPDRESETQGMDYVPWLLSQWKAAGHPVDILSLHFYPQGGEYSDAGVVDSPAVELARNRSTRDLWDATYRDPTWINSVVALIPLMHHWVSTYYVPGTPIALTEYSWGGETLMNGATTQADLLGIFGREGLDLATRWGTLSADMPVYKSIKLYRNYDGQGGGFGTTSIHVAVPDPDNVSAFAALRSTDNAMTLVVVNKQLNRHAAATIQLGHFAAAGTTEVWQLADNKISRLNDTSYASGSLQTTVPQQSVTLFVLRPSAK
ncbi:glycoside hydrolase family 44 protein [Caballeronia sp. M23-90]